MRRNCAPIIIPGPTQKCLPLDNPCRVQLHDKRIVFQRIRSNNGVLVPKRGGIAGYIQVAILIQRDGVDKIVIRAAHKGVPQQDTAGGVLAGKNVRAAAEREDRIAPGCRAVTHDIQVSAAAVNRDAVAPIILCTKECVPGDRSTDRVDPGGE